jgi:hypothetical protein
MISDYKNIPAPGYLLPLSDLLNRHFLCHLGTVASFDKVLLSRD